MKQYVYHHVFIKCSAVRRPPSVVRRPPSAVRRPPSVVRRPPSVVRRPSSAVRRPPSVVRRPPSAVRRPVRLLSTPVSSFMSRQNLLLIYHSLVEQRLNYCSEVWDTLSDGLSQKLQKLQNRAARIITKSAYDASSSELLVELRWRALAHA